MKNTRSGSAASRPLRFTRALDSKRYIVTSAQNATPVNKPFLQSLLVACKELEAELIIIPLRYKNPTSRWSASQANEETWAEEVTPYLYNARKKLNPNLALLGDIKRQPTAVSPLSGFEGLTSGESCIVGHTKVQFKVVPTRPNHFPKILTTTGAVTVPNYTDSKAGKLGHFHHSYAAIMVETQGKKFHLRQLSADKDGSFIDAWPHRLYTPSGSRPAPRAIGLAMGDTHCRFIDRTVLEATFGDGGIVPALDPQSLLWHDLLDGYSGNPHHNDNPFIEFAKRSKGFHLVREEVEEAIAFLETHTQGDRTSIVVPANHNDFLRRWVLRTDWREDVENADFYLETARAMLASTKMTESGTSYGDPFAHWVNKLRKNDRIRCLRHDESFMLADFEAGMHGHEGPNGARGSIKNLSRLGVKVISGHGHTPGIEEGHTRVGTSTPLRMEYTGGPSSWLNTHAVVYGNGKRSLITIIDGDWHA